MEKSRFFNRISSISPMVDFLAFITTRYTSVKNANESFKVVLEGAEAGISKGCRAFLDGTNGYVPYETLDQRACSLLDKAEQVWPLKGSTQSQVSTYTGMAIERTIAFLRLWFYNTKSYIEEFVKMMETRVYSVTEQTKAIVLAALQRTRWVVNHLAEATSLVYVITLIKGRLSNWQESLSLEPQNEENHKLYRTVALILLGIAKTVKTRTKQILSRVSEILRLIWDTSLAMAYATIQLGPIMCRELYLKASRNVIVCTGLMKRRLNSLLTSLFPSETPLSTVHSMNVRQNRREPRLAFLSLKIVLIYSFRTCVHEIREPTCDQGLRRLLPGEERVVATGLITSEIGVCVAEQH